MDDIILDWFCLINTNGIGSKTFWSLLKDHKTAKKALQMVKDPFPYDSAQKILKSSNAKILLANDPRFPKQLRRSMACPPMLFYKGDESILKKEMISIIGARNASIHGKSISETLAKNLSSYFAIVSGLAKGIDTSAHKGSLENVDAKAALAVLPFSIENVYPQENIKLHESIEKYGLLLSEVPPHKKVDQGMFHARNRIVAGLSCCIVVIEAAIKSGTMETAKLALDLGVDVFAVPGSPIDPRSAGSNFLIKNGAPLVENFIDVLNLLGYEKSTKKQDLNQLFFEDTKSTTNPTKISLESSHETVLSFLSDVPISVEQLAMHAKIDMTEFLYILSELEMMGKIVKYPTNYVVLA